MKTRRLPSLSSLYLGVGLVALFLVLTRLLPSLLQISETTERPDDLSGHVLRLSETMVENQSLTVIVMGAIAVAGLVLPILSRPLRWVVWVAAGVVFLLTVVCAFGAYFGTILDLTRSAGEGF